MNTRLKQFLAAENISQSQFADTIKVVRASVSHILAGRNKPGYEFLSGLMSHYPNLNIEWLMFGKGKMYRNSPASELPLQTDVQQNPGVDSDVLFPDFDETPQEPDEIINPIPDEPKTQVVVNQRKVSKIIVLFDDGSYQEM